ncbi:MAG: hypothetical protein RLZZ618_1946 [Pseudomonadota bacterium]|jgi:putative flippase GtrA
MPAVSKTPRWGDLGTLWRYGAVGVAATLSHYMVLVAGVELAHWPAWVASGVGAVVGAQVAYAGNRWFTFGHTGTLGASWGKFQFISLVGAGVGMAIVAALVALHLHYLLAQVTATVLTMLLTYQLNRLWTFR